MDIKPYNIDPETTFPLPLYESIPLAEVTANGDSFAIVAGLDKHMAEQVKQHSLDENDADLQEHTSDRKRFGEGSYEEWYSKKRTPFALIHEETDAVTAICWFGPKPLGRKSLRYLTDEEAKEEKNLSEGTWHTISYRCYNPYRGKGLMNDFVRFCINTYTRKFPGVGIWAIINVDNPASKRLAEKLGFKMDPGSSHPDENLVVMVLNK